MIACYIIYTASFDKFYVGATQEDVRSRLNKHNTKSYDNTYTAFANDWQLHLVIECDTYAKAINIERHIKRMKSKIYIRNLKKYPEMVDKLLLQF